MVAPDAGPSDLDAEIRTAADAPTPGDSGAPGAGLYAVADDSFPYAGYLGVNVQYSFDPGRGAPGAASNEELVVFGSRAPARSYRWHAEFEIIERDASELAAWATATSSTRRVIYQINDLDIPISRVIENFERLERAGLSVVGAELGNELYFGEWATEPRTAHYASTAEAYVAHVRPMIAALRAHDPRLPLSVPIAPSARWTGRPEGDLQQSRFDDWNRGLAEALNTGALDVDAVTPHMYLPLGACHRSFRDESALRACYRTRLEAHTYEHFVDSFIRDLRGVFGVRVQFWMTEWSTLEAQVAPGNTLLGGIFTLNQLLDFARSRETEPGAIDVAHFQLLLQSWSKAGLFQAREPTDPTFEGTSYAPTAAHYAFVAFAQVAESGARFVEALPAPRGGRAYVFRAGETTHVLVSNPTDEALVLPIGFTGQLEAISGDDFLSAHGLSAGAAAGLISAAPELRRVSAPSTAVVPPRSYGVLTSRRP